MSPQTPPVSEVSLVLQSVGQGDAAAVDRLFQLLYADLHRIAHAKLHRGPLAGPGRAGAARHHRAGARELLRLAKLEQLRLEDRGHFSGPRDSHEVHGAFRDTKRAVLWIQWP